MGSPIHRVGNSYDDEREKSLGKALRGGTFDHSVRRRLGVSLSRALLSAKKQKYYINILSRIVTYELFIESYQFPINTAIENI